MKKEMLVSLSEIYLMQLALKAMEKNLYETGSAAVSLLGEIGASSAQLTMENSTIGAVILLEDLGNAAIKKKDENFAKAVIQALGNLGSAISQCGLNSALVQTVWSLETIRILTQVLDLEVSCHAAKEMLESLNTVGILDEEHNLEKIQEIKKFHSYILERS
jgi:hypothetical protein